MRKSSLTAYFTDPDIISHIYRQLDDLGFKGGRVLDPSMGSGNFFSAMPEELKQESDLYGVEIETLSDNCPNSFIKQRTFKSKVLKQQTLLMIRWT